MSKTEMRATQLFCENLKYLIKRYGMQLKNVEKKVGVSQGYFSRTAKTGSLPLEVAFRAAKAVDSNLHDMTETDMGRAFAAQELREEIARLQAELEGMEEA